MFRRLWRDYGLSLALAGLFIISWFIQTIVGWFKYSSEQRQHGEAAVAFGPDGYFWQWAEATFENWQSEFLQLFTFVVLTTFLLHRNSHESRDSDDEMQASLQRIEKQLGEIKKGQKS